MQTDVDKKMRLIVPNNLSTKNLEQYYSQLSLFLDTKPTRVEIDCSKVQRATSSHINILWDTRYSYNEAGAQMHLVSVSNNLVQVLKVLDLYVVRVGEEDHESHKQERNIPVSVDKDNSILVMEFLATSASIKDGIKKIKDFLGKVKLGKFYILEIETIFYEVASNIRLHSQIDKKNPINLNATLSNDKIVLRFVYPGVSFDPMTRIKDYDVGAVIKQRQKRGYGLIMINRMADEVTYNRTADDLNELNIVKYWEGASD